MTIPRPPDHIAPAATNSRSKGAAGGAAAAAAASGRAQLAAAPSADTTVAHTHPPTLRPQLPSQPPPRSHHSLGRRRETTNQPNPDTRPHCCRGAAFPDLPRRREQDRYRQAAMHAVQCPCSCGKTAPPNTHPTHTNSGRETGKPPHHRGRDWTVPTTPNHTAGSTQTVYGCHGRARHLHTRPHRRTAASRKRVFLHSRHPRGDPCSPCTQAHGTSSSTAASPPARNKPALNLKRGNVLTAASKGPQTGRVCEGAGLGARAFDLFPCTYTHTSRPSNEPRCEQ